MAKRVQGTKRLARAYVEDGDMVREISRQEVRSNAEVWLFASRIQNLIGDRLPEGACLAFAITVDHPAFRWLAIEAGTADAVWRYRDSEVPVFG